MTISDEDLRRWEERWRQASFPENWWNAVNRLRSHSEEREVQLTVPGPDYYLARYSDFSDAMGGVFHQLIMDGEIYVVFRKCSEFFHS